jgi:hypothetical protein
MFCIQVYLKHYLIFLKKKKMYASSTMAIFIFLE